MSIDLHPYAIVTESIALEYVQDANPADERREIMRLIINAKTEGIERYCRRPFVSRAFTEFYDGNGSNEMQVRRFPIVTLTSLDRLDDDETSVKSYNVTQADPDGEVIVLPETGTLRLKTGGAFYFGRRNYKIVYSAGFATVPSDVTLAALTAIGAAWNAFDHKRDDIESISAEGESVTYVSTELPKKTKEALKRYRVGVSS